MILSIANESTGIDLNGGGMAAPYRGAFWKQGSPPTRGDSAEDQVDIEYQGAPLAIANAVSCLERLLKTAGESETICKPLYLLVTPHSSEGAYRARIRKAWLFPLHASAAQRQSGAQVVRLFLQRDPYFEGAETEIALTNNFGSNMTGGLDIYNTCDTYEPVMGKDRCNWVQLPGSLVGGVAAPIKLQYTLQPGSAWGSQRLWISQFICGYEPVAYAGVIEVETSAGGVVVPGAADYTLYSEGYGKQFSLTSSWAPVASWTLSQAELQKLNGRFVHAVGAFQGNVVSDELYLKLDVLSGSTVVYTASPVRCNADGYQEIGTLPLPGMPLLGASPQALSLRLQGRRSNTGLPLTLDALYLLPSDAWRILDSSVAPAANESIMDNPIDAQLYLQKTSGRVNTVSAAGAAPVAIPGMVSRLYFLARNGSTVDPRINAKVRAWYRPRKEVL
jgi:hypothetical protein